MTTSDDTLTLPPATDAGGIIYQDNSLHFNTIIIAPAAPAKAHTAPKPVAKAPLKAAPAAPLVGSGVATIGQPAVAVNETHRRDANGHAVTTYADSSGASIELRARHNGGLNITFTDSQRTTTTQNDKHGFVGSTVYGLSQLGVSAPLKQLEAAKGASGWSFLAGRIANGDVECGNESASASNDVIEAVTRERIQTFAKAHPELAAKLRASGERITVLAGIPATLEQVQNTPATFQACPGDKRQGVVVAK